MYVHVSANQWSISLFGTHNFRCYSEMFLRHFFLFRVTTGLIHWPKGKSPFHHRSNKSIHHLSSFTWFIDWLDMVSKWNAHFVTKLCKELYYGTHVQYNTWSLYITTLDTLYCYTVCIVSIDATLTLSLNVCILN